MFSLFKGNSKDQDRKKLLAFLDEMEKNLEIFYVMDQRQFITQGYLTDNWQQVKNLDSIKKYATILNYGKAMEDFNNALKAQKEYEAWYTSDGTNKTPENAKKLHAMKHELDLKVKTLEAIIIPAGQDLEREMLQLGLLKQ